MKALDGHCSILDSMNKLSLQRILLSATTVATEHTSACFVNSLEFEYQNVMIYHWKYMSSSVSWKKCMSLIQSDTTSTYPPCEL